MHVVCDTHRHALKSIMSGPVGWKYTIYSLWVLAKRLERRKTNTSAFWQSKRQQHTSSNTTLRCHYDSHKYIKIHSREHIKTWTHELEQTVIMMLIMRDTAAASLCLFLCCGLLLWSTWNYPETYHTNPNNKASLWLHLTTSSHFLISIKPIPMFVLALICKNYICQHIQTKKHFSWNFLEIND